MTIRPEPRSRARTRTRTGIRATRRLSPCYRHPDEPITGICASCLRDRLAGLDAAAAAAPHSVASPELRRCRSVVSVSKCEASSSGLSEPRRKSCDVVSARSSLSTLFDVDDVTIGSESEAKVESKNVGLSRVTYTVIESKKKNQDEIRVSSDKLGVLDVDYGDSDGEIEDGDSKTMKEYIDLEFQNKNKKPKDLKEIAGNFWGAASVFSKKLRKWREKNNNKMKKHNNSSNSKINAGDGCSNLKLGERENHSDIVGRRSCDTEPRFSIDGGRISFEEPRASWDGYMIARTIPRLAPMFSGVENGILGNVNRFENRRLSVDGQMHSIIEDESSSGASGSGHSNSDSSSSVRGSSFDRSSSVRSFGKKVISSEDPVNMKLVITEKELKDWHLGFGRDDKLESFGNISRNTPIQDVGNLNVQAKKSVKWRKVCNVFGIKLKNSGNACESFGGNVTSPYIGNTSEKQGKEGAWKLVRSSSVVGSRTSCDVVGSNYRRRSVDNVCNAFMVKEDPKLENKSSSVEVDDGIMPFYMTPLRSMRNSKSGKFNMQTSHSITGNVLQLN